MTPKKWLAAAGIAGVLALAFAWGGDRPSGSSEPAATSASGLAGEAAPEASAGAAPSSAAASGPEADSSAATGSGGQGAAPGANAGSASGTSEGAASEPSEGAASSASSAATDAGGAAASTPASAPPASVSPPATPGPSDASGAGPSPGSAARPSESPAAAEDKNTQHTATLSVTAKSILANLDLFDEDKLEVLPADGVLFASRQVTFEEGDTAFDVLQREMKKNKIPLEFAKTPAYNSSYVEGIANIYEFDCGELSGWMYKVNGAFPNYGSSRYSLKDGDVVEWVYTCDLGRDVGGEQAAGKQT
ncbi:DUF4430 domain-containing protein [Cohnella fermenti]|uniref:DUF4430 domain-containing protein n=1 Tax=Cohnella fermenti TaxID=2565925 RepID=A0A4S4BWP5_9BACL|nr:DUF4430 domain-containing protein [Cohnella fermenti]THF79511.1 DUF4430 domain-containing protein [Cohnella fermenti]